MSALLVAIPVVPLVAAPFILGLGDRLPWRGGEVVVGAAGLVAADLLLLRNVHQVVQADWFESGGFRLTAGLTLDGLGWPVAMLVAVISLCVGVYSIGYMADEDDQPRFFATLAFFVGAMLVLVLANSLVLLFGAWEAVGLASYLLIGFRYREGGARDAATKAFLMTRIGDVGLLLAWLLVLLAIRTTDIAALLSAVSAGALTPAELTLIALLFFMGSMGKSAQLPLTAWLPDAMAAPTPVSALLHSATMVAAGIYLLLRLYPVFAAAPGALPVIFWVGAATAVFSALVATGEMDLKRLLAWSTSSQLGEMVLGVGLGGPLAATMHFMMHATFKSALFLSAGAVDKHTGSRDLRRLHGLRHALPAATFAFLVGGLSLAGLQTTIGRTSDEAIVATALATSPAVAIFVLVLILLGGLYVGRAGSLVFLGSRPAEQTASGRRWLPMRVGMLAVSALVIFVGFAVDLLGSRLPFPAAPETTWAWRSGALMAGIAGLGVGAWHAHRHGPRSVFGRLPGALSGALVAISSWPPRAVLAASRGIEFLETGHDRAARSLVAAIRALATASDRVEQRLFDPAARALAAAAQSLATASDMLERAGFAMWADSLSGRLRAGGRRLRQFETGKLYLYTLGIFIWSLAILIAGGLIGGF